VSDSEKLRFYLLKAVAKACHEFKLLEPGDRIAVGVSGGKDSFTLLELLVHAQRSPRPVLPGGPYTLVALHVDGSAAGLPDLRPVLQPWLEELGVAYAFVPLELRDDEPRPLDCFRCAFNRRKTLFLAAERLGCTKIAFGHHLDDAAATALMNLLQQGRLEGLPPRREFFRGHFALIRPLIYLTEADTRRYARSRGWELAPESSCPRAHLTRRKQVEAFLASFPPREREQIRANLWRAALPNTLRQAEE